MAYDFLNTTTYTNQLSAQENLLSQMQEALAAQQQSSPLGSGFDLNSYDSDLIEIMGANEDEQQAEVPTMDEVQQPDVEEVPVDDTADMELINSMFQQEAPTPRPKTRTVYVQQQPEEDEDSKTTYQSDGRVSPRIWQYGGKTPKYQVGGVAMPNTNLSPSQEQQYDIWRNKLPSNLQYEGDYNLKQLWLENSNQKPSPNMHFPDKYKLPNHPTFSNESMYFNPTNQYLAGSWQETDSSWNYIPYNNKYKKTIVESKQMGGTLYADNYETQRIGLNDPNYNTAVFNTEGTNTFRGLDNHQPVAITDGKKYKVLHGPKDTAKFEGKVYEQKMQTGGTAYPATAYVPDAMNFFKDYLASDKYKERLTTQGYTDPQDVINKRLKNTKTWTVDEGVGLNTTEYDRANDKIILDPSFMKNYGVSVRGAVAHEVAHKISGSPFVDDPNYSGLNTNEVADINSRNKSFGLGNGHDNKANEVKADVDALRYMLYKDKIYDAGKENFTPELLKKAKEKYKGLESKRLFKNFADEDLIHIMNSIAQNNTNNNNTIYDQA